jgi:hypothetical protein
MNTVPVDIFAEEAPASRPVHRPAPEQVRVLAEEAEFHSRQPVIPAATPPAARRGRPRTGRTAQFACRITPAAAERFYQIAQERDWSIGATVERALAALEEKLRE